jgi:RHS repeat-associated protein
MTPTGMMISRRMYSRNLDQVVADQDATQTRWFLVDQVGSTRDLVSHGATDVQHYIVDSYGRLLNLPESSEINDISYTGREDTHGSSKNFRNRTYDPRRGRFLQEDRVGPFGYSYVNNNPLVFYDPFGFTKMEMATLLQLARSVIVRETVRVDGRIVIKEVMTRSNAEIIKNWAREMGLTVLEHGARLHKTVRWEHFHVKEIGLDHIGYISAVMFFNLGLSLDPAEHPQSSY